MNLDFIKNIEKNLKNLDTKGLIEKFINELSDFLEKNSGLNITNQSTQYNNYWKYQKFMEDNVSSTIGLSRSANDITYKKELSDAIDDSILEVADKEGTLYRKQFSANGSPNGNVYKIDKFDNGEIEHLKIPVNEIPNKYKDEDIIFQYTKDGQIEVREDLKEEAVEIASKKCKDLKLKEDEKAEDFKKEGHIYSAFEDDGYIFLKDLTEKGGAILEDIDFAVNLYEGEGKYQVIDGKYKKM